MNNDDRDGIIIKILFALLAAKTLFCCLLLYGIRETKQEAVKRGAAEWVVDASGATTFTWKEPAR